MNQKHKQFMLESNRIEGEYRINPGDINAIHYAINMPVMLRLDELLHLHSLLGSYLNKSWVGKFRVINVKVGNFIPVSHQHIQLAMEEYIKDFPMLDSWSAHNKFEKIHPFQDLNGRVGRLLWLNKAIDEGYDFSIPFLQAFYYQTLSQYERR